MLYVANKVGETTGKFMSRENKEDGALLCILPGNNLSSFLVTRLHKFGLTNVSENDLEDFVKTLPLRRSELPAKKYPNLDENLFGTSSTSQSVDSFISLVISKLEQGSDVFIDSKSFVLLLRDISQNNKNYYNLEKQDVKFSSKVKPYFLENYFCELNLKGQSRSNLDKLLKLFSLFYSKRFSLETNKIISSFQYRLIDENHILSVEELENIQELLDLLTVEFSLNERIVLDKIQESLSIMINLVKGGFTTCSENNSMTPTKDLDELYRKKLKELIKLNKIELPK